MPFMWASRSELETRPGREGVPEQLLRKRREMCWRTPSHQNAPQGRERIWGLMRWISRYSVHLFPYLYDLVCLDQTRPKDAGAALPCILVPHILSCSPSSGLSKLDMMR